MSFDYQKSKNKIEDAHGNSWTAYSDLFMMLSTVFLLLYVAVSLRSQTSGVEVHQKVKQLAAENADLQQQIQVYNTLRDNHLQTNANDQEQEVYKKLMSKLDLLKEESNQEKNELTQKAKELQNKEYALNEYQRLIRNIINTNVLSKTQLQRRDAIIEKKETINSEQRNVITDQKQMISTLNVQVEEKEQELNSTQKKIARVNEELKKKIAAIRSKEKESEITRAQMNKRIAELKEKSEKTLRGLKKMHEEALGELNQAKAEKERALSAISGLQKQKEKVLQELGDANAAKGRALASIEGLEKQNEGLNKDLKRAKALANARKELATRIKAELKRAGLTGNVDEKSGDVTLSFGEEYFDTGSAQLKPSMMTTLKKFMPGYSKSLFSDQKIAKNIENVEIVGFASSTYRGKYVPPDSLKTEDREAINYNLKLSFNRANSIFEHIFDKNKMSFEHQRDLLPKIKVVGRGYLPDGVKSSEIPAGIDEKNFCNKFNCKQAQKVIIKFKLKD